MAGSPGGQEIGRVSVKVIPDTSDFDKQKLERRLNKEVKDAGVAVRVHVEIDKKALDKVRDDLRSWVKKINPLKVIVRPELALGSTTFVNQRLNYMSRARTVPILPYLVPGGVLQVSAGLTTMMAALSGGRVIQSVVADFGTWLKSLDKAAPKLALVTQGLLGIVGLGLTAGSNLFALSASLASIGAVALTLPATFASAAIGVGVLIAAFKDFNKVLPGVKTQLSELQNMISGNFWAKAKTPFQEMINDLFPKFSKGLAGVSTEFGSFFGSLATALGASLGPSIGGMFTQLSSAITIAKDAAAPLAQSIATLGSVGASYLPQMSKWVVTIATQFNDWLTKAAADGSLKTWIDNGLAALHELGQVLKSVYGIFSGISEAATLAGGSGLGMMADTLAKVSAAVNSPGFQGGLVKTLTAAHQAMSNIATSAGPAMGKFFETLSGILSTLLPVAGTAIGSLLSSLATAFSNPAFVGGFESLIKGMADAIARFGPALTPIAGMLGALGGVLGQFLGNMAPVLGDVLGTLAGAFQSMLPALRPLISILTGALGAAFKMLAPVIMQLGQSIGSLIMGGVLPMLVTAFKALLPVIATLAPLVGNVLGQAFRALAPLLPMIGKAFASIVPLIGQLIAAVFPLIGALLPALGAILGAIIPVVVQVAQAVLPPLIAAVTALVSALVPVIGVIAQVVVWLVGKLAPVITFVAGLLVSIVTGLLNGFTNIFSGIMGIWDGFVTMFSGGWGNFFSGLGQVLLGIWEVIKGVFEVILNIGILGAAKKLFTGLKAVWTTGWNAIKAGFSQAIALLQWSWSMFLTGLKKAPSKVLSEIKLLFTNAMTSIRIGAQTAWTNITKAFGDGVSKALGFVKSLPSKATEALGNVGSALASAGRKLIEGFITGIKGAIGGVKDTLQGLTKKLTDWKGPESLDRVLLVNAGQLIIDGLITGMESRYDGVRRSLQGLTSEIGATVIASPQVADLSGSYSAVNTALAQSPNAAPVGGNTYEINVPTLPTNSSPEDVADAILHAQKRFAFGSAYAM